MSDGGNGKGIYSIPDRSFFGQKMLAYWKRHGYHFAESSSHSAKKRNVADSVFYFSTLACLDELCVNLIGSTDKLC